MGLEAAIRVEGLSKKYRIGAGRPGEHRTLRDALGAAARNLGRRQPPEAAGAEFWALKDVSFTLKQGEKLGIVGRNGAGKSTLLKVLSRITEPTTGRIKLSGRVASLLEVGTGFHPELTGRENVYLNGAILGMGRTEIDRKFDEIVAFSEVEKFIDTPVKRYSSGMYVRLAFAVAAHLEPEILIVDEVLAVGDIAFQEKCLGKLEDISTGGISVLFVSHNLDSLRKLCRTALYLEGGTVKAYGPATTIIDQYLGQFRNQAHSHIVTFPHDPADRHYIERVEILNLDGTPKVQLATWDAVRFRIYFYSHAPLQAGSVVLQLSTLSGTVLSLCSTQPDHAVRLPFEAGWNQVDCVFPKLALSAGRYLIGAALAIPNAEWLYRRLDHGILNVYAQDVYASGLAPDSDRYVVAQEHTWEVPVPLLHSL